MTDLELIKSQLGDIANRLDELHQALLEEHKVLDQ
jgi:hypothetical protein